MGTQAVIGCLFYASGRARWLEESITDASEDELHARDAATTPVGTLDAGETVTHAWVASATAIRYANIKVSGGVQRVPIPCGSQGVADFSGKMKLKKPHTLKAGDIIAVWTEA